MKRLLLTVSNFKRLVGEAMILGRSFCIYTYLYSGSSFGETTLTKKPIHKTSTTLDNDNLNLCNVIPAPQHSTSRAFLS